MWGLEEEERRILGNNSKPFNIVTNLCVLGKNPEVNILVKQIMFL